jgi:MarR family transcriptional regulator, organic hydroperoxide resistance regulator
MLVEMAAPVGEPLLASPAAREAWAQLFRLVKRFRAHVGATLDELELSPAQAQALRELDPGTPLPMSRLADVLACDASNVTGIVDRLEDRGLVERRPAEHDRRVKMLTITERGAEVRARLAARLEEPPEPLARLSVEDQRTLRDIMRRAVGRD